MGSSTRTSFTFTKRIPELSKLTVLLLFILMIFCGFQFQPATTTTLTAQLQLQFEKLPIQGTYIKLYQTGFKSESALKCALVCMGSSSSGDDRSCNAFNYYSTTGTCDFYHNGTELNPASSFTVFLIQQPTDVFRPVYVEGQLFSIYLSSLEHQKNYQDARDHCHVIGGYLLQIDSSEEYQAVEMVFKEAEVVPKAFIGANDLEETNQWVNDRDGSPVSEEMLRWEVGAPSHNTAHCVAVVFNSMRLNDMLCSRTPSFLCERDLVDVQGGIMN